MAALQMLPFLTQVLGSALAPLLGSAQDTLLAPTCSGYVVGDSPVPLSFVRQGLVQAFSSSCAIHKGSVVNQLLCITPKQADVIYQGKINAYSLSEYLTKKGNLS